jgi:hypothetical protein
MIEATMIEQWTYRRELTFVYLDEISLELFKATKEFVFLEYPPGCYLPEGTTGIPSIIKCHGLTTDLPYDVETIKSEAVMAWEVTAVRAMAKKMARSMITGFILGDPMAALVRVAIQNVEPRNRYGAAVMSKNLAGRETIFVEHYWGVLNK